MYTVTYVYMILCIGLEAVKPPSMSSSGICQGWGQP